MRKEVVQIFQTFKEIDRKIIRVEENLRRGFGPKEGLSAGGGEG